MALRGNRIAVVGGGAAGLAAAVTAARGGACVDVLEVRDRVGNSIKVTGDGRCNIDNAQVRPDDYRNAAFVRRAFQACSPEDVRGFLESLGLLLHQEAEGRLYPHANKSTSVIDALRLAADRAGVRERCGVAVSAVVPEAAGWGIRRSDGSARRYDCVVLANGGSAQANLLPKGVSFHAMQPVLGPLATDTQPLRGLDKVRARCALQSGDRREVGEATFRNYGISGIAAFNMSRFVREGDVLHVDFLPDIPAKDSADYLQKRLTMLDPPTWLDYTCGMLLPLVARAVLRAAGLSPEARPRTDELPTFHRALHSFPLTVRGIGDVRLCQVHRGGVDVASVDPATMRVCGCPGLYAVGEMLDVDGPCGGYNLHWAWTSGIIAGRDASRDISPRDASAHAGMAAWGDALASAAATRCRGPGHAGGITSASADGMRAAKRLACDPKGTLAAEGASDEDAFAIAVDALRRGHAVVFPTDTVAGLGVSVLHARTPDEIFRVKRRDEGNPVAWLVAGVDALRVFGADLPEGVEGLARACWPGPLTIIVKASESVPPAFRSQTGTIGLRMPDNQTALRLMRELDSPLATSSANVSGEPAPGTPQEVALEVLEAVDAVLVDDGNPSGKASTVLDCSQGGTRILREGAIDAGTIRAYLGTKP